MENEMEIHGFTESGSIDATIEGVRMTIPDDMSNRHRQMIAEWEAEGNTIPAYEPEYSAEYAIRDLVALLSTAPASTLASYPAGEPQSWPAKEAEALAAVAAGTPTPADYPLLQGEIAAEFSASPEAVTAEQISTKSTAVLVKAAAWRALVSRIAGLRQRYSAALEAATTAAGRRAAIDAAATEIGGLAGEARQPLARSGSNA